MMARGEAFGSAPLYFNWAVNANGSIVSAPITTPSQGNESLLPEVTDGGISDPPQNGDAAKQAMGKTSVPQPPGALRDGTWVAYSRVKSIFAIQEVGKL
jgi:hypothetical protein